MRTDEALRYAQERDLDLVEVAPDARPPVTRILDYSKYKYEQAQKQKAARKHQQQITIREIKFRPKIAQNDYDTKKGHVNRFLKRKDKVKITIMFRGREVTHPERGQMLLERLAEELKDLAMVEQRPNLDGRNMTMMLGPSKAVLSGQIDEQPTDEVPRRRGAPAPTPPIGDGRRRGRRPSRPRAARASGDRRRRRGRAEAPPSPLATPSAAAEAGARPPAHRRRAVRPGRPPPAGVRRDRVPYCSVRHAEDEDPFRREEALQADRQGQGPRPALLHEPHPREEVAEAEAPPRQPADPEAGRRQARQEAAGGGLK